MNRERDLMSLLTSLTVALSGFLMFLLEPMLAKSLLPTFGGSPATWTVSLVFFQICIFAGSGLVWLSHRYVMPKLRMTTLIGILVLNVIALPKFIFMSQASPSATISPEAQILLILIMMAGGPFLILATTSSLLQDRSREPRANRTLHSYAVSNIGALLGLLCYPILIEPFFPLSRQFQFWAYLDILFIALYVFLGLRVTSASRVSERLPEDQIAKKTLLVWLLWSALGAALLSASTEILSNWIPATPFLWLVPMISYLLSFVWAFRLLRLQKSNFRIKAYFGLATLTCLGLLLGVPIDAKVLFVQFVVLMLGTTAGFCACHAELAMVSPDENRSMTFFTCTSAGGLFGGLFVAFVVPIIFVELWEYHLLIFIISALLYWRLDDGGKGIKSRKRSWIKVIGAACLGLSLALILLKEAVLRPHLIWRGRNFYGPVAVTNYQNSEKTDRRLIQNGFLQGREIADKSGAIQTACDFRKHSGLGLALRFVEARRVGGPEQSLHVGGIGLGVGMILALAKSSDRFDVFEINPNIVNVAEKYFSFIPKMNREHLVVEQVDGRLALQKMLATPGFEKYDVLVLDAFRGNVPPLHLLTQEAFSLYFAALKDNGILVIDGDMFNFDLSPVLRAMAHAFQVPAHVLFSHHSGLCLNGIDWTVMTRDAEFWRNEEVQRHVQPQFDIGQREVFWTDDWNSLVSVLQFNRPLSWFSHFTHDDHGL